MNEANIATAEGIFRDNEKRKVQANRRDHAGAASFKKKKRCPICGGLGLVNRPEGGQKKCPNPQHKQ